MYPHSTFRTLLCGLSLICCLTVVMMIATPRSATAQDVPDVAAAVIGANPQIVPACSTQNGADMCIFQGPANNTSEIKIGSGNGFLWYGNDSANAIVHSTTAGVTKTCPTLKTSGASPFGIVLGPDKRMWFTEFNGGSIGAVTKSCGVTEYPLNIGAPADAIDIIVGADNNLWFTTDFNGIGTSTTAGVVSLIPLPDNASQPTSIALGSDGNVWFLEANGPCFQGQNYTSIGNVSPQGVVKEYNVKLHGNGFGIAGGPDGRIWFADPGGCDGFVSRIGAIKTNGTGLKYYTKNLPPLVDTIINGGDGNLYFGTFTSQIGRITTTGVATTWNLPSSPAFPVLGMTIGPDSNIWFADNSGDFIGALYIRPVISSFTPASGPVGTEVTINGYGFTGSTAVEFDGVKATSFSVISGFQITAKVPTGAKTGKITVTNKGGVATSTKAFTVN
jgi:streptogramin lyase